MELEPVRGHGLTIIVPFLTEEIPIAVREEVLCLAHLLVYKWGITVTRLQFVVMKNKFLI